MLIKIIANTPTWVWGLLAALVLLGISQLRTRTIPVRRAFILPAAMTGLSLAGTVTAFAAVLWSVLPAWAAATVLAAWITCRRRVAVPMHFDPAGRLLTVPGSWTPMLLILGIFAIKYVVGVVLAMQPDMSRQAGFATAIAVLYGALSGVFAGRAWRIRRLMKEPAHTAFDGGNQAGIR